MADDAPHVLDLPRHRDLVGRRYEPWVRRAITVVMVAVVLAGLLERGRAGSDLTTAGGSGGTLSLEAPSSASRTPS